MLADEEAASEVQLGRAKGCWEGKAVHVAGLSSAPRLWCDTSVRLQNSNYSCTILARSEVTILKKAAMRSAGIEATKRGIHSRDH